MVQIRYDFRWGAPPFAGGWGNIWTPLPPGLVHATNGPSRLSAHLWTQLADGSGDKDWRGTALIGGGSSRVYPMFNWSSTRADMGFYQISNSGSFTAGTGTPTISGYYPEGGSLVISGVIEVQ